jgi:hypothetical protein
VWSRKEKEIKSNITLLYPQNASFILVISAKEYLIKEVKA